MNRRIELEGALRVDSEKVNHENDVCGKKIYPGGIARPAESGLIKGEDRRESVQV